MSLKLQKDKGQYRCQFTYQGQRKTVYFGTDDLPAATILLRKLENDILSLNLNSDLRSYRIDWQGTKLTSPTLKNNPSVKRIKLITLFQSWIETLQLPPQTFNGDYLYTQRTIPSNCQWDSIEWFQAWATGKSTGNINKRKSHLKRCIDYHLSIGTIKGDNPYDSIKLNQPRLKQSQSTKVKPLTETEIKSILQAFESNQFVDSNSRFKHSHYVPLIKFCLTYGVRIGEAIALQWDKVDFENRIITIDCAASRDTEISPYASRKVISQTKTGIVNYLPLTESVESLLLNLPSYQTNPLVFPGHRGGIMDSKRFRLAWKQILEGLGIEYRNPYQMRHTVLSNVAKNHGLAAAASLAGHKDLTMVSRHYVKFIGEKRDIIPTLI